MAKLDNITVFGRRDQMRAREAILGNSTGTVKVQSRARSKRL